MSTEYLRSSSEEETIQLGKEFAQRLAPGDIVAFYGDLGSGKTEFVKGICRYFDVEEIVTSPTFTIMNQYTGSLDGDEVIIFHIDLYRIKKPDELVEIGFTECLNDDLAIKLIEWSEKAEFRNIQPTYSLKIKITGDDENERIIEVTTY
ncbi:MAG: tRNA (adenosine(37)-N6)-threonylcarbamoyltransferase complex ATPase subunit type 1 TsaE [Chloroflexota bacterium]